MESNYIINLDYGDFKYSHYELLVENGEFELTSSLNRSLHISATSLEEFQDSWVKNVKEAFPLLHNWIEVTSGEPLSKYLDKKVSACGVIKVDSDEEAEEIKSEPESFKVVTKHTDAVTYETELPNISLSDKTLRKQANYIADAISKKFEENTKKQKNEATSIVENETTKETKEYTLDNFNEKVQGVDADVLSSILRIKKALLLISPPGTGKTTTAIELAKYITKEENSSRVVLVSFSQTTSYSDVIGGYSKKEGEDWKLTKGSLFNICDRAISDSDNIYIYIIDEINRANTESVLGEAITALAKRGENVGTNIGFTLKIPNNLWIIATMNSTDASITELDTALIDRFAIYKMEEKLFKVNKIKAEAKGNLLRCIEYVRDAIKDVNEQLKQDSFKKDDNKIGNRALYTDYNNIDDLLLVIEYDIRPKVEAKKSNLDSSACDKIDNIFTDLIKKLNEAKEWENSTK